MNLLAMFENPPFKGIRLHGAFFASYSEEAHALYEFNLFLFCRKVKKTAAVQPRQFLLLVFFQFVSLFMRADFVEGLGLNLKNALAGYAEFLADFFQSVRGAILQTKTHLQNFLFAGRQVSQDYADLIAQ